MTFNPWPIRDVGDGNTGWIQGRIVGDGPLVAPASRRPCHYYHLIVDDHGEERRAADELTIEDDTGHAVIVLAGALMQLDYDHDDHAPLGLYARRGFDPGAAPYQPRRREAILGPGELIAVYGTCVWERDPNPARYGLYRDLLPQRLRVTRTAQVRHWISEDVPERQR